MKERDTRNEKVLEEFVLVRNDNTPIFSAKDVVVKPVAIGKNGPVFEISNKKGERMGIVNDNNVFEFDHEYKEHIRENVKNKDGKKDEKLYEKLGLEEQKLKINITEELKKQQEKNNKDKKMDMDEIKKYSYSTIKNYEYAKTIVGYPEKYDYMHTMVVDTKEGIKVYTIENATGNVVEIPQYLPERNTIGEMDSIENNKEQRVGKGREIAIKTLNGDIATMNIKKENGELEIYDTSKDIDGDGTYEGERIETESYKPNPEISNEIKKYTNDDKKIDNQEKEEIGIETNEIGQGSLSDEQIKEILDDKEVSESIRRDVISQIGEKNPSLEELEEMIENAEYKEQNQIESDEHTHEHTLYRRPPVY